MTKDAAVAEALTKIGEALADLERRVRALEHHPKTLALRLRERAAKDEELAKTKLNEMGSFMYVLGRAQTLKAIVEELDVVLKKEGIE